MKRIIAALLCIATLITNAQEASENFIVGILPLTVSDNSASPYKSKIEGIISEAFTTKKRFTVVDRTQLDKIANERNLQKQEDFIDGQIVEQGKSLGAQYLIQGNISQLTPVSVTLTKTGYKTGTDGKLYSYKYNVPAYNVTFGGNMQVIDVATGQVKTTKSLTFVKQWEVNNQEIAVNKTLDQLQFYVAAFTNDVFPVYMKVIKIESTNKKGIATKILIKGGSDTDLRKGQASITNWMPGKSILQVYENEALNIEGKSYMRQLPIGEIVVEEVQGDFTVCKVKEGGEEITKRLNESKTLLLKILKY